MKYVALSAGLLVACASNAEPIGSVDTTWRMLGANDSIQVERFDDPEVENVSCYVSYAKTGGVLGSWAEDPSRFSIACRAVGLVAITGTVTSDFEEVFARDSNWLFKEMRVSRMLDEEKNVLVYLVWSTQLIDGSPFNSITAVPLQ